MLELAHITLTRNGRTCLDDVSLGLQRAERVALVGASGSGKSSLARIAAGSLTPQEGTVLCDGIVGLVRQDPTSQMVSSTVLEEAAFGPANTGLERNEVLKQARAALDLCGLKGFEQRLTSELSGGQQQRLALASVLSLKADYLVLDEAASLLDPAARKALAELIDKLVSQGVGVLEISHEPESIAAAKRVLLLEQGRLIWEGDAEEFLGSHELCKRAALRKHTSMAYTAGTARTSTADTAPAAHTREKNSAGLIARSIHLSAGGRPILRGVDFAAAPGVLTLLAGASGAGKTSLARVLAGVLTPDTGTCTLEGLPVRPSMVGLALQRPEDQLFCETVAQDIAFAPRMQGLNETACWERVSAVAAVLDLEQMLERGPRSLSGGERRRAALASIAAQEADAFVFDEPGAGLDGYGHIQLQRLVDELLDQGRAVALITHDIAEWIDRAAQVYVMSEGKIVWQGSADELRETPQLLAQTGLCAGDEL